MTESSDRGGGSRTPALRSTIQIAGRTVGGENPCFIVAEAGVCHFGSLDIARALVDIAVEAGADAVKFQVFKTEELVSRASPEWIKRLKPKELPYEAFADLKNYCAEKGIIFFATAHEEASSDFLADLGVPVLKIGSGEVNNPPFIRHLAAKGLPMIISTGLHDEQAIEELVEAARAGGCDQIALLHCVTAYPTPVNQVNLRSIPWMARRFGCPIGYSDHTLGIEIPVAAAAVGASIIEKHISLDKAIASSQDSKVSCDRRDLIAMVAAIRNVEAALGVEGKSVAASARLSENWARKSAVASRDLAAGTRLASGDLAFKRPGTGVPPNRVSELLGRTLSRAVAADQVLSRDDLADDSGA